ncbi:hypothetical protein [Pseudoruegeria sp. SK021]|uniref:hypothetical protein n=1 Tax=Pseudoruegeria sp. SK021 TaxID=1933035 RepID=UPI000A252683|nr:hypothetical protein [Pseudoruegeria sp. SK021]OSP54324.1 hypothetical protein BV911_13210 [Pseudoruegeria sp. SK021]
MKKLIVAIAVFSGLSSAAQAAPVLIDAFNAEQIVAYKPIPGFVSDQSEVEAPVIGGYRDISVVSSATAYFGSILQVVDGEGSIDLSNTRGVTGSGSVTWDGMGSTGLGGIDLTDGGSNDALITSIVFSRGSGALTFSAVDTNGVSGMATYAFNTDISSASPVAFLFSSFSNGVDLTSVNSLTMLMSGIDPAASNSVGSVYAGVAPVPAPVPLPAAGLLLGTVLLGGGVAARRRKTA